MADVLMAYTLNKLLSYIGLEKKSAPEYGQPVRTYLDRGSWFWNRWSTEIDYRAEFGPLDESYLVMAVINWTATQLPEAPPVVMKPGKKNGALEPEWGHPCADLIRRPNPFDVWANDCLALSISWWIDGNVYWLKARNEFTGEVEELWYLPHFMVEERWPGDGRSPEVPRSGKNKAENDYISHYQYNVPGKAPVLYKSDDMLHVKRGKDPSNPRRGMGAFASAIRELYGDRMMAQFSATLMKNMGITVPLLSPKDPTISISEEQARSIEETWVQKTTGANAGKPIINSIQLDVEKFAWSPTELDLSRLRLISQSVVAALSGIPAALLQFMVGLENGTSFAAYKEAREQGYESVIIPIQSAIAEQLTWQLLPEFDKTKGARIEFDTANVRVLQSDRDGEYKRVGEALSKGAITVNQYRASLDKESVPEGDVYLIPSLSKPMTPERLLESANSEPIASPVAPIDPASAAKFMEMERMFAGLEEQMKEFTP